MLTREEALLAARVADKYPPGHGRDYGYSEHLKTDSLRDSLAELIRTNPSVGKYG